MSRWEDMNKDELERQFSPSQWSHRMSADDVIKSHVTALKEGTERARGLAQTLLNVPYGEGEGEKLDVYVPTTTSLDVPLVIYLHGGYWQFLSKEESGFMAVPLVHKGVVVVAVGYDIAPKGNMDLMVSQVRRSVVSVIQQYSHISGLYLCGHSAGAHLAAMILSTDWSQYSVTPQIKGAFLVSGIYDLLPILSTYVNEPLKMTEGQLRKTSSSANHWKPGQREDIFQVLDRFVTSNGLWWSRCVGSCTDGAQAMTGRHSGRGNTRASSSLSLASCFPSFSLSHSLSLHREVALRNSPSQLVPQLKLSSSNCDIVVAVAQKDSPEFRKQSEDYYKTLESTEGLKVTLEDVPNTDHFNIIEQLVDGDYHLTQLLLKMMGKS